MPSSVLCSHRDRVFLPCPSNAPRSPAPAGPFPVQWLRQEHLDQEDPFRIPPCSGLSRVFRSLTLAPSSVLFSDASLQLGSGCMLGCQGHRGTAACVSLAPLAGSGAGKCSLGCWMGRARGWLLPCTLSASPVIIKYLREGTSKLRKSPLPSQTFNLFMNLSSPVPLTGLSPAASFASMLL